MDFKTKMVVLAAFGTICLFQGAAAGGKKEVKVRDLDPFNRTITCFACTSDPVPSSVGVAPLPYHRDCQREHAIIDVPRKTLTDCSIAFQTDQDFKDVLTPYDAVSERARSDYLAEVAANPDYLMGCGKGFSLKSRKIRRGCSFYIPSKRNNVYHHGDESVVMETCRYAGCNSVGLTHVNIALLSLPLLVIPIWGGFGENF